MKAVQFAISLVCVVTLGLAGCGAPTEVPRSGTQASEANVVQTLLLLTVTQAEFRSNGLIDEDKDGHGEFAGWGEITSTVLGRQPSGAVSQRARAYAVTFPGFDVQLDRSGRVLMDGYFFQMLLPRKGGGWEVEGPRGFKPAVIDPSRASQEWLCFAWPMVKASSDSHVFVVGPRGPVCARPAGAASGSDFAPDYSLAPRAVFSRAAQDEDARGQEEFKSLDGRSWSVAARVSTPR